MSLVLDLLLALAAFAGHFALAVWLYNRAHAMAWPVWIGKLAERTILIGAAAVLGIYAGRLAWQGGLASDPYVVLCWILAALVVPLWLVPKLIERKPFALVTNDTHVVDVAARLGFAPLHGVETRLLAALPGNQILHLHVQRKTLRLPRLPSALAGLTIAHLSDLHMIGDLTEDFYGEVVAATNELAPDLICITGDILEKTRCLPWIATTLGRLEAKRGKYFILGNHEMRLPDVRPLRAALVAAGFIDLGSRCQTLSIQGTQITIAGTERPWFGTNPPLPAPSLQSLSPQPPAPFRILLSHTPDQFAWARRQSVDLMLAGHNHGGQIRLPGLGALVSPSWHGWRYSGGLYYEAPTLMHVSRGISAKHPIRLNCPPEIALLVLQP